MEPAPEPDRPTLLNRVNVCCEILATDGGKRRVYLCRSYAVRVNPKHYPPAERARLELGVTWEVTQALPEPARDGPWEVVRQHRNSVYDGAAGPADVWPLLANVIRSSFASPSRVRLTLDRYPDDHQA